MGIAIPILLICFTCLLIWRACDGFEVASRYIGRNLSEGVRGGTINAISSSIPEFATTLIGLLVLSDTDGFAIGLGTTAGSALFNGMIIPAACIFTAIGAVIAGVRVGSVNVSTKVLLRDGLALIGCEFVLILIINGESLHWWQGLVLIAMYAVYFALMLVTMRRGVGEEDLSTAGENEVIDPQADDEPSDDGASDGELSDTDAFSGEHVDPPGPLSRLVYWASLGPLLDLESFFVGDKQREQIRNETWNGWPLLITATTVIGVACFGLVKSCEWLGTGTPADPAYELFGRSFVGIGMPPMFVAVIFASMATSVPDTIMSIRDSREGDYDDAVANALGSNIFDICFALGFPLFLFTLINGPIRLAPEVAQQSGQLRLLLLGLTVLGFLVYYIGRRGTTPQGTRYVEMRRGKAMLLLVIYAVFVVYILGRAYNWPATQRVSEMMDRMLNMLPMIS